MSDAAPATDASLTHTAQANGRKLAEKAIQAHGGAELWRNTEAVRIRMSGGGLMIRGKGHRKTMRDVTLTVPTTGQRTIVEPYGGESRRGVFDHGRVRIETPAGEVLASRDDARPEFRRFGRFFRWDELDFLYFSGYAMWTYLSLPFILNRTGYEVREVKPQVLEVTFPEAINTHCSTQRLHFDDSGLLWRHDYTAEPVGSWAHSVHLAREHRTFGGLVLPTRRRVYPRSLTGGRVPFPPLVSIDIEGVELL
jgi:hypothetical protein